MRMPAEPPPKSKLLTSFFVTASRITRFAPDEPEGPPETSTRFPSGVNFKRLPLTGIGRVCVAFLVATSMMVTLASWAFAAQISLPSGERSNPSEPRPAPTLVTRHVFRGEPGGGPPEGGIAPGGGPGFGADACSMMLIV